MPHPSTSSAYGIWSLNEIRNAVRGENWPIVDLADGLFANTALLLQADDFADGSQNNTFLDSSTNTHSITRNGNVTQGSFSPFSQDEGKWGNYFDGSGDYLQLADDAGYEFGTGEFTVETWLYRTGTVGASVYQCVISPHDSGATNWGLYIQQSTGKILLYHTTQTRITSSGISNNQWTHVAATRDSSNTTRIFIDGVKLYELANDTANYTCPATGLRIGFDFASGGGNAEFLGYMSNARIVKGTAVYTSDFTPSTTPLTAISGTSLLTCQSNRFVDSSSNAHAITVNGTPKVTPFSPFKNTEVYNPTTHGASAYFDGTGDKLATDTRLAIGTQDFTVEAWVYLQSGGKRIIIGEHWAGVAGGFIFRQFDNDYLSFYDGTTNQNTTTVLPRNVWQHVACTRSGTTLRIFVNGTEVLSTTNSSSLTGPNNGEVLSVGGVSNTSDQTWDGYLSDVRVVVGTAVYTSNFTPPTAPLTAVSGTSLLCNFTNAGIFDATRKNVLETVGDAQVDTAVKKFGTGSMQFDGTGDRLVFPPSEQIAFGTGDFTVEFWANSNDVSGSTQRGFLQTSDTAGGLKPSYTSGVIIGQGSDGSSGSTGSIWADIIGTRVGSSSVVSIGEWFHVALVRSSGTITLYVNGTSVDSVTEAGAINGQNIVVGGYYDTNYLYDGYLDDLRITKGVARYTANFTPPTKALPAR